MAYNLLPDACAYWLEALRHEAAGPPANLAPVPPPANLAPVPPSANPALSHYQQEAQVLSGLSHYQHLCLLRTCERGNYPPVFFLLLQLFLITSTCASCVFTWWCRQAACAE